MSQEGIIIPIGGDVAGFKNSIKEVERISAKIDGETVSIKVDANTDNLLRQIKLVDKQLEKMKGQKAELSLKGNNKDALAKIAEIDKKISKVSAQKVTIKGKLNIDTKSASKEVDKFVKESQKKVSKSTPTSGGDAKVPLPSGGGGGLSGIASMGAMGGPMGLAVAGVAAVGVALVSVGKDIYDFVDGINEIERSVARMTSLTGQELTDTSNKIASLARTYEIDPINLAKSIRAAAENFDITYAEASNQIGDAFARGGDRESLLEGIEEYSAKNKDAGISLETFIKIKERSEKQGIISDKALDTVGEFGTKMTEMTDITKAGLKLIGISGDDVSAGLADGSVSMGMLLEEVSIKTKALGKNSKAAGIIMADVYGGAAEDAGSGLLDVYANLGDAQEKLSVEAQKQYDNNQRLEAANLSLVESTKSLFDGLGDVGIMFDLLYAEGLAWLAQGFLDLKNTVIEFLEPFGGISGIVADIIQYFKPLTDKILPALNDAWKGIKKGLNDVIGEFGDLGGAVETLSSYLMPLGEFIMNVLVGSFDLVVAVVSVLWKYIILASRVVVAFYKHLYDLVTSFDFVNDSISWLVIAFQDMILWIQKAATDIVEFIGGIIDGITWLLEAMNFLEKSTDKNTESTDKATAAYKKEQEEVKKLAEAMDALNKTSKDLLNDSNATEEQISSHIKLLENKGLQDTKYYKELQAKQKSFDKDSTSTLKGGGDKVKVKIKAEVDILDDSNATTASIKKHLLMLHNKGEGESEYSKKVLALLAKKRKQEEDDANFLKSLDEKKQLSGTEKIDAQIKAHGESLAKMELGGPGVDISKYEEIKAQLISLATLKNEIAERTAKRNKEIADKSKTTAQIQEELYNSKLSDTQKQINSIQELDLAEQAAFIAKTSRQLEDLDQSKLTSEQLIEYNNQVAAVNQANVESEKKLKDESIKVGEQWRDGTEEYTTTVVGYLNASKEEKVKIANDELLNQIQMQKKGIQSLVEWAIAKVFISETAKLGPLGIATAAVLTGLILSAANVFLGAEGGAVDIDGNYKTKPGPKDIYNFKLARHESVINSAGTLAGDNKNMIKYMNTGKSYKDFPGFANRSIDIVQNHSENKKLDFINDNLIKLRQASLVNVRSNHDIIVTDNRAVQVFKRADYR